MRATGQLIRLTKPRKKNPPVTAPGGFLYALLSQGLWGPFRDCADHNRRVVKKFCKATGVNRWGLPPSDFFRVGVELLTVSVFLRSVLCLLADRRRVSLAL